VKASGVRAVLFDLDGTLADTAPDLARALNRVRAEQGLAPLPPEVARPHTSSGARGLLKAGFDIAPENEGYRALRERFLDFYEEELCVETRLFDGIPELLVKIRARKLPWGIVTNKGKRFTEPLLRLLAVDHLAGCVVSGDSTRHIKPHPAPLLLAAVKATGKTEIITLTPDAKAAWKKALLAVHREQESRIGKDIIQGVYKDTGFKP